MKPNEIVRAVMTERGYSNASLAAKMGKVYGICRGQSLSRENGMRIDTLMEMLDAMDCEIVIKSKLKDKGEWKVTKQSD